MSERESANAGREEARDLFNKKLFGLVREASAARKEGDIDSESRYRLELAILDLKDMYGVDNLSTIELVHLRRIVDDIMRRDIAMAKDQDPATNRNINTGEYVDRPEMAQEASDRWLHELYGIDAVEHGFRNYDELKEAIRYSRDTAHLV
jgi:hypothetical protein